MLLPQTLFGVLWESFMFISSVLVLQKYHLIQLLQGGFIVLFCFLVSAFVWMHNEIIMHKKEQCEQWHQSAAALKPHA